MKPDKPIVVKIGGSTLGEHDTTIQDIVALQKAGRLVVVVHGGGKLITQWLSKQGIATGFVRGQRVTDKASLDVVVAVLAGLVNKEIVASINAAGGKAVGLSGVDDTLIRGRIKDAELGFVGEVTEVNAVLLKELLGSGYVPVIAPIGFYPDAQAGSPQILNINADTVAGDIAAAVGAERLVFLTDVEGVLDKSGKLLEKITPDSAKALISSGVASGGMIPKIEASLRALAGKAATHIIDGRKPHALMKDLEGRLTGTAIG